MQVSTADERDSAILQQHSSQSKARNASETQNWHKGSCQTKPKNCTRTRKNKANGIVWTLTNVKPVRNNSRHNLELASTVRIPAVAKIGENSRNNIENTAMGNEIMNSTTAKKAQYVQRRYRYGEASYIREEQRQVTVSAIWAASMYEREQGKRKRARGREMERWTICTATGRGPTQITAYRLGIICTLSFLALPHCNSNILVLVLAFLQQAKHAHLCVSSVLPFCMPVHLCTCASAFVCPTACQTPTLFEAALSLRTYCRKCINTMKDWPCTNTALHLQYK